MNCPDPPADGRDAVLHLLADLAPRCECAGFAVAALGLPSTARWTVGAVRIDPGTFESTPVDARRGVPIARLGAGDYVFREAADVRRTPKTVYGFLMATDTSRALFPHPRIVVARPGTLASENPILADPYSLCQASGAFPRPAFALRPQQAPVFTVANDDHWKIENPSFTFDKPLADLLKGGEWAMSRAYDNLPLRLNIDSAIPKSWDAAVPPANLDIDIPPFGKIDDPRAMSPTPGCGWTRRSLLLGRARTEDARFPAGADQPAVPRQRDGDRGRRRQPVVHRPHSAAFASLRTKRADRHRARKFYGEFRIDSGSSVAERTCGGPTAGRVHRRPAAGRAAAAALRRRLVPFCGGIRDTGRRSSS